MAGETGAAQTAATQTGATQSRCRRVVLKISGEGFVHPGERGIAMDAVVHIARQTFQAAKHGVQIAPISPRETPIFTRRPPIIWACWPRS